jgi:hypothetical protein
MEKSQDLLKQPGFWVLETGFLSEETRLRVLIWYLSGTYLVLIWYLSNLSRRDRDRHRKNLVLLYLNPPM